LRASIFAISPIFVKVGGAARSARLMTTVDHSDIRGLVTA
jgi:hypothetical protein